jgi:hypothetical protein
MASVAPVRGPEARRSACVSQGGAVSTCFLRQAQGTAMVDGMALRGVHARGLLATSGHRQPDQPLRGSLATRRGIGRCVNFDPRLRARNTRAVYICAPEAGNAAPKVSRVEPCQSGGSTYSKPSGVLRHLARSRWPASHRAASLPSVILPSRAARATLASEPEETSRRVKLPAGLLLARPVPPEYPRGSSRGLVARTQGYRPISWLASTR